MSFESELLAVLSSAAALQAVVQDRICLAASANPATAKPYLVFEVIATDEPGHMSGTSGLARSRVQFRAVGETMAQAIEVREALRACIHTLHRNSGVIRDARIEDSRNAYFQPPSNEPVGICSQEMDYIIWHAVDQPSPV